MDASEGEIQIPISERILSAVDSQLEPVSDTHSGSYTDLFAIESDRSSYLNSLRLIIERAGGMFKNNSSNILKDLTDIASKGELKGHSIPPVGTMLYDETNGYFPEGLPTALTHKEHLEYRIGLVATYLRNPEIAEAIVANKIIGLHSAPSGVLLSVLEKGLMPLETLRDEDIEVVSGAKDATGDVRQSVSFVPLSYYHSRNTRVNTFE